MLVLTRLRNEAIQVGDDIVIRVVEIRGNRVRIGIEAPADTPINRMEVHHAIKRNRERGEK